MLEFPPEFFCEETRCDFVISSMMKKAWAAQMEVLQMVARICENNGLSYFAAGGTLLGAVRHQGFIPWDDDIDIALKREDYNELIRILPKELPHGVMLGGMYAEPAGPDEIFPHFCSRVRTDDSGWDFKSHMERFHGFPYIGVGVDIFPFDYIPRDREMAELQDIILAYGKGVLGEWERLVNEGELEGRIRQMEELCGAAVPREGNIKWNFQKLLDSVAALCPEDEADEMTMLLSVDRERLGTQFQVRKECLESVVYMPFEQIEIAVPCGYHEMLTAEYGEYMTFVKGTQGHGYPSYGEEEKKLIRRLRELGIEDTVEEFCRKVSAGEIHVQMM